MMTKVKIVFDPKRLSNESLLLMRKLGMSTSEIENGELSISRSEEIKKKMDLVKLLIASGCKHELTMVEEGKYSMQSKSGSRDYNKFLATISSYITGADGNPNDVSSTDLKLLKEFSKYDFKAVGFKWNPSVAATIPESLRKRMSVSLEKLKSGHTVYPLNRNRRVTVNSSGFSLKHFLSNKFILPYNKFSFFNCPFLIQDVSHSVTKTGFDNYLPPIRRETHTEERHARRSPEDAKVAIEKLRKEMKVKTQIETDIRKTIVSIGAKDKAKRTLLTKAIDKAGVIDSKYAALVSEKRRLIYIPMQDLVRIRDVFNFLKNMKISVAKKIDKKYLSLILNMYHNLGSGMTSDLMHFFVNPKLYRRSDITPVKPGDKRLAYAYKHYRKHLIPHKSAVPASVRSKSNGVIEVEIKKTFYKRDDEFGDVRSKHKLKAKGSMVCVGHQKVGKEEYAIFATAIHLLSKAGVSAKEEDAIKYSLNLNNHIQLIAVPLKQFNTNPSPLAIASGNRSKQGFIYTLSGVARDEDSKIGLGSDPKYVRSFTTEHETTSYNGASKQFNQYMLFRGANKPKDSGGAVVDAHGNLIGIILAGDKLFTVAAYADMQELNAGIRKFKAKMKKSLENK